MDENGNQLPLLPPSLQSRDLLDCCIELLDTTPPDQTRSDGEKPNDIILRLIYKQEIWYPCSYASVGTKGLVLSLRPSGGSASPSTIKGANLIFSTFDYTGSHRRALHTLGMRTRVLCSVLDVVSIIQRRHMLPVGFRDVDSGLVGCRDFM